MKWPGGGIGRHSALKMLCLRACGFESRPGHLPKDIYGQSKLDSIQMRDYEKEKQARDKGINLLVIPDLVSNDKYLNEAYMKIKKIIEDNL